MALKLVTAPATYPVTLDECKAHCNVDFTDHDSLLEIYRRAATEDAENFTGRAFIEQTWDFWLDAFPEDSGPIYLPRSPLIELVSFGHGAAGDETAITRYVLDNGSEPARLLPAHGEEWPEAIEIGNAVRMRFKAGYVTDDSPQAANVPFAVKSAILLTVGTLYAHRETVIVGTNTMMMPWASKELLRPYRVYRGMA